MNYQLNTTILESIPVLCKRLNDGNPHQLYVGLDVEQSSCAVSVVIDGGTPVYLGKRERQDIVELVSELTALEHGVAVAEEACGFGYEFHRQLLAVKAQSIVVAPEALNGKRKTDKADSRKLAIALFAYLNLGNETALRPIRVPSLGEQQVRALHRERAQAMKLRNLLAAQARSLAVSFNVLDVPVKWWGKQKWPIWLAELQKAGQDWLIQRLEAKIGLIRQFDDQINTLDALTLQKGFEQKGGAPVAETPKEPSGAGGPMQEVGDGALAGSVLPTNPAEFEQQLLTTLPKGFGVRTILNLSAEVCDWYRFNNRGQIGSFMGICPSEYSSGPHQRLGAIDRQGNAAGRTMLVEAAWRMVRYQPGWRGLKKYLGVLSKGSKASKTARRKAIVAVARLLAVDIWRLQTGRCTLEELGFTPAVTPKAA